jgi:hypothetical protein
MPLSDLVQRLRDCPSGLLGWKEFEDVATEILTYLFVPPLETPHIQPRTYSGIDRRDAVFPNRSFTGSSPWALLYKELDARLILFEFKNFDKDEIGKDEVNQTRNYLTTPMGRLAILCCNKQPAAAAYIKRNTIYSEDRKVVLFVTGDDLEEMIYIKDSGEDPANLLMDLIERFYLSYE